MEYESPQRHLDGADAEDRSAWLAQHAFTGIEIAIAMNCVRPAKPDELRKPTTVIAVQGRLGMITLYWAPVLAKPEMLLPESSSGTKTMTKRKPPRILGVVDLEKLAKLDPSAVGNRFGMWRGAGPGAKGPGEISDPERDAARDRLKGRER